MAILRVLVVGVTAVVLGVVPAYLLHRHLSGRQEAAKHGPDEKN